MQAVKAAKRQGIHELLLTFNRRNHFCGLVAQLDQTCAKCCHYLRLYLGVTPYHASVYKMVKETAVKHGVCMIELGGIPIISTSDDYKWVHCFCPVLESSK